MYEITSILGQLKRNQTSYANARRMLLYIGVTDEKADELLADAADDGRVSQQAVQGAADAS